MNTEELKRKLIADPDNEELFQRLIAMTRRKGARYLLYLLEEMGFLRIIKTDNFIFKFKSKQSWVIKDIYEYFLQYYDKPKRRLLSFEHTSDDTPSKEFRIEDFLAQKLYRHMRRSHQAVLDFKIDTLGLYSISGVLFKSREFFGNADDIDYVFTIEFSRKKYIVDPICIERIKDE